MKIWIVVIIATVFVNACARKPTGLLVNQNISYDTKIKHIKDCRAIAKGQAPTHLPASTYNSSAMTSQPLAAQGAAGFATGIAEGWMRAKARSENYKGCMSGLGYKFSPLNESELEQYKNMSTDEKAKFMQGVYEDILSGKRKERKL